MQMRDNGVEVNDTPKHLAVEPTNRHHSMYVPATATENEEHKELLIPLRFKGVTHYFPARKPTVQEFESTDPAFIVTLTAEDPNGTLLTDGLRNKRTRCWTQRDS